MNTVPTPITVKVLFFAKTRELSGSYEALLQLDSKEITVSVLKDLLCEKFNLNILKSNIILALNENYCEPNQLLDLKENDEIALIPPISGG